MMVSFIHGSCDGLLVEHVLGKGEDDGPRPPGHGGVEGVAHVFRNAARIVDLGDPLGELPEHAAVVDLLECLAIENVTAGLADEEQDRRRILEGGVDADRGMRRAGATVQLRGNQPEIGELARAARTRTRENIAIDVPARGRHAPHWL